MIKKKDSTKLLICLLLAGIYFFINFVLLQHHEVWRDESQAWVLVKHNGILDIFKLLSSEGHPPLWFLCIYPFAKGGLSFWQFGLISLTIMTAAVFILFYCSGYSFLLCLTIMGSSAFLYFNAVICRVYALVVLIIVMMACLWKNRYEHCVLYGFLVACIIQTHILMCGFAFAFLFDVLFEICSKKKASANTIIGMLEVLISLVLLICFLYQSPSSETFLRVSSEGVMQNVTYTNLVNGLKSIIIYLRLGNKGFLLIAAAVLFLGSLLFILVKKHLLKQYKGELVTILFSFAAYISIICFVRNAQHPQMAICGMILLIFACQITITHQNEAIQLCSKCFLVFCCIFSYYSVYKDAKADYFGEFSHSKQMASFILDNIGSEDTILLINNNMMTSIYAYVSDQSDSPVFIDIDTESVYQFHKWGKQSTLDSEQEILDQVNSYRQNIRTGDCYYLSSMPLSTGDRLNLNASFTGGAVWEDESYYLYKCR